MTSRSRKRVSDDFIDDDEPARTKKYKHDAVSRAKPSGLRKSPGNLTRKEDANGDGYWEISKMRRVTVSSFRGKTMVHIREYYEKDGEEHPGKKGISLPVEQFSALLTLLPDIEAALKEKGVPIPRPNYVEQVATSDVDEEEEDSTDELSAPGPTRRNIEATSDEDEEEE
ncbi:transcriptional Coactivator p15-domain-containing protein [Aspergillus heterothallicus]